MFKIEPEDPNSKVRIPNWYEYLYGLVYIVIVGILMYFLNAEDFQRPIF